jgi:hypothetical protein
MSYYKSVLINSSPVNILISDTLTCIRNNNAGTAYSGIATINSVYASDFNSNINERPKTIGYSYLGLDLSQYSIAKNDNYTATTSITIPSWCNKISVILVGKGGNGAGGGTSIAQYQDNRNNNVNQGAYHQNINVNVNYWATGYTGGSGGGGAFTFITNLQATPSSTISLTIDATSTRITHNAVNYFATAGSNGVTSTAGAPATTKSTGDQMANGSGATSGISNYSTSLNNGTGGAGGAGGAGGFWADGNPNHAVAGAAGSSGVTGYCRIYWLVE